MKYGNDSARIYTSSTVTRDGYEKKNDGFVSKLFLNGEEVRWHMNIGEAPTIGEMIEAYENDLE